MTGTADTTMRAAVAPAPGQEGTRFAINTTCAAQGDGSPNKAGSDNTDSFVLNRLSRSRFEFIKVGQDKAIYRWCSMKTVD